MKLKTFYISAVAALAMLTAACMPESPDEGNGLKTENLDASFNITPATNSPNRFTISASNNNYIFSRWNIDDGAGFYTGKQSEEIFLPDAGTYTIQHQAYGIGGVYTTTSKTLTVATSDPNSGNLVQGGKFETAEDIAKWTVLRISDSGTQWAFANGKATATGGGWNQQAIYQPINVVAGKTYKVDMVASSTTGVVNTWFEVYMSPLAPVQGTDYSDGGKKLSINTWAGCGMAPFSGKVSNIGCPPNENEGLFTATATGVVYLVIKVGGEDLKAGISIDNVEVRGS